MAHHYHQHRGSGLHSPRGGSHNHHPPHHPRRSSSSGSASRGAPPPAPPPPPPPPSPIPPGGVTLPTPDQCDSALHSFVRKSSTNDDPAENWRKVVLTALAYGTDYETLPRGLEPPQQHQRAGGGGGGGGRHGLKLKVRGQKCFVVLSEALEKFGRRNTSYVEVHCGADSKAGEEASEEAVTPYSTLVDALWLVGSVLSPSDGNESHPSSKIDPGGSTMEGYENLCHIVHSFAFPPTPLPYTPWLVKRMQTSLEPNVLAASGLLLPNKGMEMMLKKMKKINTDLYYRQHKFNLMQEESEGYGKLLSLLVGLPTSCCDTGGSNGGESPSGAAMTPKRRETSATSSTSCSAQTESTMEEVPSRAMLRVRELIGAFDLDPNRVLDLTLDVLESNVSDLLSTSGSDQDMRVLQNAPHHRTTILALMDIIRKFNGEGSVHLIGFKFSSYATASSAQSSSASDAKTGAEETDKRGKDPIPQSLYVTAALLALHDVLDVRALVPHLDTTSSQSIADTVTRLYKNHQRQYTERIRKLGAISLNSSSEEKKGETTTAANGTASSTKKASETEVADISSHPVVRLLRCLLRMGAWDHAVRLAEALCDSGEEELSRICTLLPEEMGDTIFDLIKDKIRYIYGETVTDVGKRLMPKKMDDKKKRGKEKEDTNTSDGNASLLPSRAIGTLTRTSTTVQVVRSISPPLRALVGSGIIRTQPILYCQLCRLLRRLLQREQPTNDNIDNDTYELLRVVLLPSLSLFPSNPAVSADLWSALSILPYRIRYQLYTSWRSPGLEKAALRASSPQRKKPLPQIEAEVNAGIEARYVLKRLSKDNIRDMGRKLSKVSHANPLVVFTTILNQIESYDNLITMMVETFKFVTALGLDVMGYCLLGSLGGLDSGSGGSSGSRSKLKSDGVNASQWLSSLETFTGAFYKKFPDVEFRGIISYITHRLRDGHVLELGVLRTLLKTAGGFSFADSVSTASLSKVQLDGRSGSQLLKRETSSFGVVEKLNRKSSRRVRSVLQSDDVGVILLMLLAQIRNGVLFHVAKGGPKHIKLIGNLYDTCQVVLGLLLEFLTDSTSDEEPQQQPGGGAATLLGGSAVSKFASSLPTLGELCEDYGVEPAVAWMLCRPVVRAAIFAMEDREDKDGGKTAADDCLPPYLAPYILSSPDMRRSYQSMLPESSWKYISPELFELFYSYSLYDVHYPESRYASEIARLKKEEERLTQLQRGGVGARAAMSVLAATAAAAGGTEAQIQQAMVFSKADEQELDRVKHNAEVLTADSVRQKKHCESVRSRMESVRDGLLGVQSALRPEDVARATAQTFLMRCVYPRCMLSPEDATYCAHFVRILHAMETPGFPTLQYVDGLVHAVVGGLYCITEDEAGNLGFLLEETWRLISGWRYDEKVYEKEVLGKPGSRLLKNGGHRDSDANEFGTVTSFNDYTALYNRWHATLGEVLLGCLRSSEYMHTRAALIVLTRIVEVYPTRPALGERMLDALGPLQGEDNPRQDIRQMALAYGSQLAKARDSGVWKELDASTAKARLEKEKAAAEERNKKAKQQLEEMKRESEMISREIGGGRPYERRYHPRGPYVEGGGGDRRGGRSPLNPSAPTFTPANGGAVRDLHHSSRPATHVRGPADSRELPREGGSRRGLDDHRDRDREWDRREHARGAEPNSRRTTRERDPAHHGVNPNARREQWDRSGGDDRERVGGSAAVGAPSGGVGMQQQAPDRGTEWTPRDQRHRGGVGQMQQSGAGLEGRWQRSGAHAAVDRDASAGVKRGRSPNRDVGGVGGQAGEMERGEKRLRTDRGGPPPSSGGPLQHPAEARRGIGDRDDRVRGNSSPSQGARHPPLPPLQHSDRGGSRRSDRRVGRR